jgi:hypothetical protein
MKDTLTKILSARPEDSINTASTINLEDDQGYFGSYSSVDIHYEMLKVIYLNLLTINYLHVRKTFYSLYTKLIQLKLKNISVLKH